MDEEANVALGQVENEIPEKMVSQSQLNEIVKREKLKAAERARMDAEQNFRSQSESSRPNSDLDIEGFKESLKKDVYDQFMGDLEHHQQKLQQEQQEKHLKGIVDQYYLKMGKGSELFDDFNEIMGDFEPDKFPNTVLLAAQMDNAPEIMYELANNPSKLQEIEYLAERSKGLADKQLKKLSASITTNLDAKKNVQNAPNPLSRLKSSSVGADTGKMSMKDLKRSNYLKA